MGRVVGRVRITSKAEEEEERHGEKKRREEGEVRIKGRRMERKE